MENTFLTFLAIYKGIFELSECHSVKRTTHEMITYSTFHEGHPGILHFLLLRLALENANKLQLNYYKKEESIDVYVSFVIICNAFYSSDFRVGVFMAR